MFSFMYLTGRIVCYLPVTANNQRNSEGCFVRLKDGSILYAWSMFYERGDDLGQADIGCIRSYDEGDTWVERRVLYGDGQENLMCPTLMRMENGDLGLFYVYHDRCRNSEEMDGRIYHKGMVRLVRSRDEGLTWSEPIQISRPDQSFCFENGHGIRLKSGRILLPMAYHRYEPVGCYGGLCMYGVVTFYYSDDDGYTWQEVPNRVYGLPEEITQTGLQEPMAYQTEDGRIRVFCRTDLGVQYETVSDDDGITWSEAQPNRFFTSPCSPMVMKRSGPYTVAAFNPIPRYVGREDTPRTPMVLWVSDDDSKTFTRLKLIDQSPGVEYPDLFDGGDYILVGYQNCNDGVIQKIWHGELA